MYVWGVLLGRREGETGLRGGRGGKEEGGGGEEGRKS